MIVYCPWCNKERIVFSVARRMGELEYEWRPCSTPRCRGAMITLVTDDHGFAIHPRHIRGQYLQRLNFYEEV